MISKKIHTASVNVYLWFAEQVERLERNEANAEHGMNELLLEWEHLTHTVPIIVASITRMGG